VTSKEISQKVLPNINIGDKLAHGELMGGVGITAGITGGKQAV